MRRHRQPFLRFLDVVGAHRRRLDHAGRGRSFHLRRRREHDPRADDGFNPLPSPELYAKMPGAYMGMGETAENVANKWQISRKEQEEFALRSQKRTAAAQAAGNFRDEIIPIKTKKGEVSVDGCPRPEVTAETLGRTEARLRCAGHRNGGHLLAAHRRRLRLPRLLRGLREGQGLTYSPRVKSVAVAGCAPEIMGIGPVAASEKRSPRRPRGPATRVVELNEAFASQSIACMRELGLSIDQVNIDGGAIALGHPLGATGARIIGKAATLLKREKAAMRWRPNASAEARASPPFWRPYDECRSTKSPLSAPA